MEALATTYTIGPIKSEPASNPSMPSSLKTLQNYKIETPRSFKTRPSLQIGHYKIKTIQNGLILGMLFYQNLVSQVDFWGSPIFLRLCGS